MADFKIEDERTKNKERLHMIKYRSLGETSSIIQIRVPGLNDRINITFQGRTRMHIEYGGKDGILDYNKEDGCLDLIIVENSLDAPPELNTATTSSS